MLASSMCDIGSPNLAADGNSLFRPPTVFPKFNAWRESANDSSQPASQDPQSPKQEAIHEPYESA
jgi:hypothetical protein